MFYTLFDNGRSNQPNSRVNTSTGGCAQFHNVQIYKPVPLKTEAVDSISSVTYLIIYIYHYIYYIHHIINSFKSVAL